MSEMQHPLIGDVSDKTTEELVDIISKLNRNLSFASRTNNYGMFNQLQMALVTYKTELNKRDKEILDEHEEDIIGKIDIR
jgi:hypothetical protein